MAYGYFVPTGKIARFLFAAENENIACTLLRYTLFDRSIDLSTDPGLKSHLITFPRSERTAASTRTFI
jgi:hypothetical protein